MITPMIFCTMFLSSTLKKKTKKYNPSPSIDNIDKQKCSTKDNLVRLS